MFDGCQVIHTYSRKEAIEDGFLIDVNHLAKTKGFKCNVCVTSAVWSKINSIPERFSHQDVAGRLWDILNVLYYRARVSGSAVIEFKVYMPHEVHVAGQDGPDRKDVVEELNLVSVAGPGDERELVITIRLPGED